jgi:TonB dependent receptor/TonB-dependent Receptor Plug Domain/CarboxypepD_reg-like domain
MKISYTFLILFIAINMAFAHPFGYVKGMVLDEQTSEPIASATIRFDKFTATTNADGTFILSEIPVGKYQLSIEKEGFQTKTYPLSILGDKTIEIRILLKVNVLKLPEVLITADRALSAASSTVLNALDFQLKPVNSAQDLMRNVPGLITAQHAGGGKAEQIFLRGFDADHGTDVSASVDGIPVNMPSHGHGQGYLDLHFLIPEAVKNTEISKGTYDAANGDFTTAGSIKFKTLDRLEKNLFQLQTGFVPTQKRDPSVSRGLLMCQLPISNQKLSSYFASEYIFAPSYFESSQDFKRFNFMSKTNFEVGKNGHLKLLLSHFNSNWNASGQVPERAVESGLITRFGAIDNTEGGKTSRQNASLTYAQVTQNQSFEAQIFASKYDFSLFSNFTLFANDSINGDMINQRDDRLILGFNAKYVVSNNKNKLTIGAGLRQDDIKNGLFNAPNRVTTEAIADATISETATHLYAKNEFELTSKLRAEIGLRLNYFHFDVRDNLPTDAVYNNYSATNNQFQIAPKLNLTYSFSDNYKLFLNAGRGFHSNDARSVVQDKSNHQLPDAWSGEVGVQMRPFPKLLISAVIWGLELDNELVFTGDDGTTENKGASRRIGLDLGVRATLTDWLFLDADVNWAKGRLLDKRFGTVLPTDNLIPLAPNLTSTGGMTTHFNVKNNGKIEGSLRYRLVGERTANEGNTVRALGYNIMDLSVFYKKARYNVGFSVENLLNVHWNEAQFDTESRLRGEKESVSELHFTPGTPLAAKMIFGVNF